MQDDLQKLFQSYGPVSIVTYHPSQYSWCIFTVMLFLLIIMFLYIQMNVNVDKQNWDIQKCNPKYLFFSGYVYNDNPLLSSSEKTIQNFNDCTNKFAQGTNESLGGNLGKVYNKIKKEMIEFDEENALNHVQSRKKFEKSAMDISAQLDAMSTDLIDASGALTYNYLKNIGIYMDQLNAYMNYIGAYVKQYLTYRMMTHANNCISDKEKECDSNHDEYKKAIQLKDLLNSVYGGNNL
jgi:hypothetical protein